jgi:3-oxoacyl-[acyl-carrier-protein] synthase II
MKNPRNVVITGLGAVTAAGCHPGDFWPNLLAGHVSVGQWDLARDFGDPSRPVYWAAERDVPWVTANNRPDARATRLALTASSLALADAELDLSRLEPDTAGIALGTTHGDTGVMEEHLLGLRADAPDGGDDFQGIVDEIAARWELWGPSYVVASSCSSGLYAVIAAADRITAGEADVMLAGGTETVPPSAAFYFGRLFAAKRPDICRPFDTTRPGMVLGEGAAMLVLEAEEHALRRGARILARLAGGAFNCDATDMTSMDVEHVAACLEAALRNSGVESTQIDHISAHGSGTIINDVGEVAAIKAVYGADAYRIAVSGIKSMVGHTTAASGPIALVAAALAIVHSVVPPTANLITPDERCDLDFVPHRGRRMRVRAAQVNAFAFGGANASVIITAPNTALDSAP